MLGRPPKDVVLGALAAVLALAGFGLTGLARSLPSLGQYVSLLGLPGGPSGNGATSRTLKLLKAIAAAGAAYRLRLANTLREEAAALEQQARRANRLRAARDQGEAAGLRKAIPFLLAPEYRPFEQREPWEIAEKLNTDAHRLEAELRSANRLHAQTLYGTAAGMRRAAKLIETILH